MMWRMNVRCWELACVAVLSLSLGACGETTAQKYKVTGTVTFDGEPVSQGYVIFYPTDNKSSDADAGPITAGKFEFKALPGPKRVEITANRPMVPEKIGPLGTPEMEQFIPDRYNKETTLKAIVGPDDLNAIDFPLKSK